MSTARAFCIELKRSYGTHLYRAFADLLRQHRAGALKPEALDAHLAVVFAGRADLAVRAAVFFDTAPLIEVSSAPPAPPILKGVAFSICAAPSDATMLAAAVRRYGGEVLYGRADLMLVMDEERAQRKARNETLLRAAYIDACISAGHRVPIDPYIIPRASAASSAPLFTAVKTGISAGVLPVEERDNDSDNEEDALELDDEDEGAAGEGIGTETEVVWRNGDGAAEGDLEIRREQCGPNDVYVLYRRASLFRIVHTSVHSTKHALITSPALARSTFATAVSTASSRPSQPPIAPSALDSAPSKAPTKSQSAEESAVSELVEWLFAEAAHAVRFSLSPSASVLHGALSIGATQVSPEALFEAHALLASLCCITGEPSASFAAPITTQIRSLLGNAPIKLSTPAELIAARDAVEVALDALPLGEHPSALKHGALATHMSLVVDPSILSSLTVALPPYKRIFALHRPAASATFASHIPNRRLLFHGSKPGHLLGILARGLRPPITGHINRTDAGMLGAGIYFASSHANALQYAIPGALQPRRFLLLVDVALGTVYDASQPVPNISAAPTGHHSVRGSGGSFRGEEFAVYNANQVLPRFLIELDSASTLPHSVSSVSTSPFFVSQRTGTEGESIAPMTPEEERALQGTLDKLKRNDTGEAALKGGKELYLERAVVSAEVWDLCANVWLSQQYRHLGSTECSAHFILPLPASAAVHSFEAHVGGKRLKAVLQKAQQARETYVEETKAGRTAVLAEETDEGEAFRMSIGIVPPGALVTVQVVFAILLRPSADALLLELPSAPSRFTAASFKVHITGETLRDLISVRSSVPCLLKRTATHFTCNATLSSPPPSPLKFLFYTEKPNAPRLLVERSTQGSSLAALLIVPAPRSASTLRPSVAIIVDTSLSMSQSTAQLKLLRRTLTSLLIALPQETSLQILTTDAALGFLFPDWAPLDSTRRSSALRWAATLPARGHASRITSALYAISSLSPQPSSVILLSDGHLDDFASALPHLSSQSRMSLFPIAIGTSPNLLALNALANAGAGRVVRVKSEGDEAAAVKDQVERVAHCAVLRNMKVEWQGPESGQYKEVCEQGSVLLQGECALCWIITPSPPLIGACLRANSGAFECATEASQSSDPSLLLHRLATRALVSQLRAAAAPLGPLASASLHKEVARLAEQVGIASAETSFVALEEPGSPPSFDSLVAHSIQDRLPYVGMEDDVTTLPIVTPPTSPQASPHRPPPQPVFLDVQDVNGLPLPEGEFEVDLDVLVKPDEPVIMLGKTKAKVTKARKKAPPLARGGTTSVLLSKSKLEGTKSKSQSFDDDDIVPLRGKSQGQPAPTLTPPVISTNAIAAADWRIPPAISNWKNARGYTIALDKRLAVEGFEEAKVNDKFMALSEALYLAERTAREEVAQRVSIAAKLQELKSPDKPVKESKEEKGKETRERDGTRDSEKERTRDAKDDKASVLHPGASEASFSFKSTVRQEAQGLGQGHIRPLSPLRGLTSYDAPISRAAQTQSAEWRVVEQRQSLDALPEVRDSREHFFMAVGTTKAKPVETPPALPADPAPVAFAFAAAAPSAPSAGASFGDAAGATFGAAPASSPVTAQLFGAPIPPAQHLSSLFSTASAATATLGGAPAPTASFGALPVITATAASGFGAATGGASLFGAVPASFGAAAAPSASFGGSLFGVTSTPAAPGFGLETGASFGAAPAALFGTNASYSAAPFGQSTNATTTTFGGASATIGFDFGAAPTSAGFPAGGSQRYSAPLGGKTGGGGSGGGGGAASSSPFGGVPPPSGGAQPGMPPPLSLFATTTTKTAAYTMPGGKAPVTVFKLPTNQPAPPKAPEPTPTAQPPPQPSDATTSTLAFKTSLLPSTGKAKLFEKPTPTPTPAPVPTTTPFGASSVHSAVKADPISVATPAQAVTSIQGFFSAPRPVAASAPGPRGTGATRSTAKARTMALKHASNREGKQEKRVAPTKSESTTTVSVFGIVASSPSAALRRADPLLMWGLSGPVNNSLGGDCWLHACLALLVSLPPARSAQFASSLSSPAALKSLLRDALLHTFERWCSPVHMMSLWRADLSTAVRLVWRLCQAQGFAWGKAHSIIDASHYLLSCLALPPTAIALINSAPDLRAYKGDAQYLLLTSRNCSALPARCPPRYVLHSLISYEPAVSQRGSETVHFLAESASLYSLLQLNHFVCVAPVEDGYWIYDDLLQLGDYQGGFVPASAPCFKPNLRLFRKRVPLAVYRLQSLHHMPVSSTAASSRGNFADFEKLVEEQLRTTAP